MSERGESIPKKKQFSIRRFACESLKKVKIIVTSYANGLKTCKMLQFQLVTVN